MLELFDLVAERSGRLVVFFGDRFLQVLGQGAHPIIELQDTVCTLRQLANVLSPLVHRFQERVQAFPERDIASAASKPAGFLEIRLRKTAHWTSLCRRTLLDFLGRADAEQQIGERKPGRILDAFFFRAGVAQIHLLHFAFQNLGQEDRRIIAFANVAQHLSVN